MVRNPSEIAVLYDGRCYLCSYEIEHYRRISKSEKIEFIDITKPNFSATQFNLSNTEVNRFLHVVKIETREVKRGTEAFVEIWSRLPGIKYKFLIWIFELPIIKSILKCAYYAFAIWIRPNLPKKRQCTLENK